MKIIFIEDFSVKQLKWELINVKEMCQWIFKFYDYDCSIRVRLGVYKRMVIKGMEWNGMNLVGKGMEWNEI